MRALAFALLVLAPSATAAGRTDPCAVESKLHDVQFSIALKQHGSAFQEGEIIPLALSIRSSTPGEQDCCRRWLRSSGNTWREDREPRDRCSSASILKPLPRPQSPAIAIRTFPREGRFRSNTITIDVTEADPQWQNAQLRDAVETLAHPPSPSEAYRAARSLRFLNSQESTRKLARLLTEPGGPVGEYLFGIYGSPYRQLAIASMHATLAAPDCPISSLYLRHLVNLQMSDDHSLEPPNWQRRFNRTDELMKGEIQTVVDALPHKIGVARTLTLRGLLEAGQADPTIAERIRPGLIAGWTDLSEVMQQDLLRNWWAFLAAPEMLPLLRRMAATAPSLMLDDVLRRMYELDAVEGRRAIVHALPGPNAISVSLVDLLMEEERAAAARTAVQRLSDRNARQLDHDIIDRYAGAGALAAVRSAYEKGGLGPACDPRNMGRRKCGRRSQARRTPAVRNTCWTTTKVNCPKSSRSRWKTWTIRYSGRALRRHSRAGAHPRRRQSCGSAPHRPNVVTAIATAVNWTCPPDKLDRLAELAQDPGTRAMIESRIQQWRNAPLTLFANWSCPSFRPAPI